MDMRPSFHQQVLRDRAYKLAVERFAPRAAEYDREASFPIEDYVDLRTSELLSLCVPEQYGGAGADFETYCPVAEQLARGNASTALTYNMHAIPMLMMGPLIKDLELPPEVRPSDEDEAYMLQDLLHERLMEAGRGPVAGHKIGCTTPIMQEFLGIDNPCAGGVFGSTSHADSGVFRFDDLLHPGVECEMAVRLGADLTPAGLPFDRESGFNVREYGRFQFGF